MKTKRDKKKNNRKSQNLKRDDTSISYCWFQISLFIKWDKTRRFKSTIPNAIKNSWLASSHRYYDKSTQNEAKKKTWIMLRINFEGLCFGVTVEQGTQTRLEEKEVLLLFFFSLLSLRLVMWLWIIYKPLTFYRHSREQRYLSVSLMFPDFQVKAAKALYSQHTPHTPLKKSILSRYMKKAAKLLQRKNKTKQPFLLSKY